MKVAILIVDIIAIIIVIILLYFASLLIGRFGCGTLTLTLTLGRFYIVSSSSFSCFLLFLLLDGSIGRFVCCTLWIFLSVVDSVILIIVTITGSNMNLAIAIAITLAAITIAAAITATIIRFIVFEFISSSLTLVSILPRYTTSLGGTRFSCFSSGVLLLGGGSFLCTATVIVAVIVIIMAVVLLLWFVLYYSLFCSSFQFTSWTVPLPVGYFLERWLQTEEMVSPITAIAKKQLIFIIPSQAKNT